MKRHEVEQKFRLKSPEKFRVILKKMGAKLLRKGLEKNELWDFKGTMRKRNSVLRLREAGGEGMLTFKGPRLKSRYKKRVETETPIQAARGREILKTLGFRVIARYEKKREEYALKNAHVTIDQIKKHGCFTEIEASASVIDALSKKFGFTAKDREERSYLEMIYGNRRRDFHNK